ncbi:unnamed protein product [Mycena citricolor]|uniref:Uncharacterized protein n=1 Tax=Mycena citricolor TaxID=2018698 RepID=A0AAD2HQX0_9AGAR|nr:unnamed protein product [Mycena citricolor]
MSDQNPFPDSSNNGGTATATATAFFTPTTLAPLSVGSWINIFLFTLELVQVSAYFRSAARRTDSVFIGLGIVVNLIADIFGTLACCAITYLYTSTHWGEVQSIRKQYWPFIPLVLSIGVVTAVSQSFMIVRQWQMTKGIASFLPLLLVLLLTLIGIFGYGFSMIHNLDNGDLLQRVFAYMALIALSIGTALVAPLSFSPLKQRNKAFKIFSMLIETGLFAAAVTITGTVMALDKDVRETMVWVGFAFVLARIYSCTMLYCLRNRTESSIVWTGNTFETAHSGALIAPPNEPLTASLSFEHQKKAEKMVMEDADAFQLTRRQIKLHTGDSDSGSSNLSRDLNDEILEMEYESTLGRDLESRQSFRTARELQTPSVRFVGGDGDENEEDEDEDNEEEARYHQQQPGRNITGYWDVENGAGYPQERDEDEYDGMHHRDLGRLEEQDDGNESDTSTPSEYPSSNVGEGPQAV